MSKEAINILNTPEEYDAEAIEALALEDSLLERRLETYKTVARDLGYLRDRIRDKDSLLWRGGAGIDWAALGGMDFQEDQRLLDNLKVLIERMRVDVALVEKIKKIKQERGLI